MDGRPVIVTQDTESAPDLLYQSTAIVATGKPVVGGHAERAAAGAGDAAGAL
jgi:hypothetical protein